MIAGVSITTLLLVLAAGIGAGFVGYAVGASSLISYPALLAFGIPPVLSNTTNTVGVCGTGIGMSMTANHIPGIRAALCGCEFQARATRQHNNANVLCLGERVTGQGVALDIAELFLNTAFEGGRHLRRINQIEG